MKKTGYYLLLLLIALVYLIFHSNNFNIDSWYYAACVKHNNELFHSHHLLYNVIGRGIYLVLKSVYPSIEAIHALCFMNSIFAITAIYFLFRILLKLQIRFEKAAWLSLFTACSFGVMRYATDAETYILPLMLSLISTYYFVSPDKGKNLILSSLFAATAILVHQLHICWAAAMFFYLLLQKTGFKNVMRFTIPFFLVPLMYYLVYISSDSTSGFFNYIYGEYGRGNASISLSLMNLFLTVINFIRSFIQIHGNISSIVSMHKLSFIIFSVLFISSLVFLAFRFRTDNTIIMRTRRNSYKTLFLLIFTFHILFAFLSNGNAEFMVMLPAVLILYIAAIGIRLNNQFILPVLTLNLFIWNMISSIIPSNRENLIGMDKQVILSTNESGSFFLWQYKPLVENIITYKNGFKKRPELISFRNNGILKVDSLLNENKNIYTDIPSPINNRYSREGLIQTADYKNLIKSHDFEIVDSFTNIIGKKYIYLIKRKT